MLDARSWSAESCCTEASKLKEPSHFMALERKSLVKRGQKALVRFGDRRIGIHGGEQSVEAAVRRRVQMRAGKSL